MIITQFKEFKNSKSTTLPLAERRRHFGKPHLTRLERLQYLLHFLPLPLCFSKIKGHKNPRHVLRHAEKATKRLMSIDYVKTEGRQLLYRSRHQHWFIGICRYRLIARFVTVRKQTRAYAATLLFPLEGVGIDASSYSSGKSHRQTHPATHFSYSQA